MAELVTVTVTDHVAEVRLNRPEKMNALSIAMFEAISAAAEKVMQDTSVRAVVLSGEGRSFCAGLDLSNFTAPDGLGQNPFGPGRGGFWPNFYQRPGFLWKEVPVPVICALHGAVFGGGLQIALGADIRIAHPDTKLSVMEIKWGLIPDMSGTQTLRDLVRLDVAKELTFTGRIVEAEEAQRIGLVTRLDNDPREAALAMAKDIAQKNPHAVVMSKLVLETSWHDSYERGLELEEKLQHRVIGQPNQIEAVMAAMQKRPANFKEREITRLNLKDALDN